jgi:hypothetical protein
MAILTIGRREQSPKVVDSTQRSRDRQIDSCATRYQCIYRVNLTMHGRRPQRALRIRSAITEQIDQIKLDPTLTNDTAGGHEHESFFNGRTLRTGIKNHLGYLDNIGRQTAMANRILRHELQQRGVPKVVSPLKDNMLMNQPGMLLEMRTQTRRIAGVKKLHRETKRRILNSFVMRQADLSSERWPLDMRLQSDPTRESMLTSNRHLRVAELERGLEDLSIGRTRKPWMKLSNLLRGERIVLSVTTEQILGLMLEVVEVGLGWELSNWHGELPLVCPGPRFAGRK